MLTAELYLIPHAAWYKIQHKYVMYQCTLWSYLT